QHRLRAVSPQRDAVGHVLEHRAELHHRQLPAVEQRGLPRRTGSAHGQRPDDAVQPVRLPLIAVGRSARRPLCAGGIALTRAMKTPPSCGKCGVALSLSQADLAADGYRCLSCSTDDALAASAADNARDRARVSALHMLRLSVLGIPVLWILIAYAGG